MKKFYMFLCMALFSFQGIGQEFQIAYDHTALRVSNLESSAKFYAEVLQLREIEIPYDNPILRWFSLGDPYQLHLIEMNDKKVPSDMATHLALHTANFDTFLRHLEKMKIPYWDWEGNPQTIALRQDGVQQVYLQDPDGHWIEINDSK